MWSVTLNLMSDVDDDDDTVMMNVEVGSCGNNALFERFAPPYFVFVLILNNLYSLERSELEYKPCFSKRMVYF